MLRRIAGPLVWLGVCLYAIAAKSDQDASGAEWRFLPTDYVDTWVSAFQHRGSGAFIGVERGFTSMLDETAPRIASQHHEKLLKGNNGTWTYSYVTVPVGPEVVEAMPESCHGKAAEPRRIEATFTSESSPYVVWNFTSFTCTALDRSRVAEFLLDEPDRWSVLMDARQLEVKVLREADIASLTKGDDLEQLQLRLGLAASVARHGTGFELTFAVMASRGRSYARLRFDQAGKLTDWKLEEASSLP